jgi:hypothetical protein
LWEIWAIDTKYLSDDMKAKHHIGRSSVNEKIILKWVLKEQNWIKLAENIIQW